MFIPEVYAFTYDLDTSVNTTSVIEGTVKEIKVNLKNVQGVSGGFGACSMKIELDSNILLNGDIRSGNGWTLMPGDIYAIETSSSFVSNSEMLVIPVKISDAGSVRLTNIECSDGETMETIADKTISFTIKEDANTATKNDTTNNTDVDINNDDKDSDNGYSSTDLIDIILNEGTIDFDPAVTEYTIKVSDFDALNVTPVLADKSSIYILDDNVIQNGKQSILITVQAQDGSTKAYVIYVDEEIVEEKDNNKYVPIFIGIICILVLINVVRIIKNLKK